MPVGWEATVYVLVAVRQGQRRDTVATGEERFGRCTEGQMAGVSLHHGALAATAFLFDRCFVLTTPNEIIAKTLHFFSLLGIHRVY
jgi:hypothetical protein